MLQISILSCFVGMCVWLVIGIGNQQEGGDLNIGAGSVHVSLFYGRSFVLYQREGEGGFL